MTTNQGIRIVLYSLAFFLAFWVFSYTKAEAAMVVDPQHITDPTYPSGTSVLFDCETGNDFVSYEADGGSDNGANDCGHTGTWLETFSSGDNGSHIVVEVLGYPAWTTDCGGASTLTQCRESDAYVSEYEVCLGVEDCDEGPPEEPTASSTATSTVMTVDNPVQNLFYGLILFWINMYFIVWFFKKRN